MKLLVLALLLAFAAAQCRFRNAPDVCHSLMNAPRNAAAVQRDIDSGACDCFNFCDGQYVNNLVESQSLLRCAVSFSGLTGQCGGGTGAAVVAGCLAVDQSTRDGPDGVDFNGNPVPINPFGRPRGGAGSGESPTDLLPGRLFGPLTVTVPGPSPGAASGPSPEVAPGWTASTTNQSPPDRSGATAGWSNDPDAPRTYPTTEKENKSVESLALRLGAVRALVLFAAIPVIFL